MRANRHVENPPDRTRCSQAGICAGWQDFFTRPPDDTEGSYRTQSGSGWSLCRSLFCPFCETPRKFDELREQAYTFAARIFVKKHRCNFSVPLHYGIYLSPVSQLTLANGVWWRGAGSVRISGFFRIEESLDRAQRGQSWGKGDKDGINQITKSVTINKNYERCTKTIRVGAA
jgi:hypothetical protein